VGALTVLGLAQSFCRLKGLTVPTVLFASTDAANLQILEVINKVGRHIVNKQDWQGLKKRIEKVAIAGEDQGVWTTWLGEDPSGVGIESFYNDTTRLPIEGPLSDEEYQQIQALVPLGPLLCYKIYNNHLYITGDITAGDNLAMMIKSRNWLKVSALVTGTLNTIAADTDIPIFDDELMLAGIDAFYRQVKELPWQTQMAAFNLLFLDKRGEPGKVLHMDQGRPNAPKPGIVVPPGNWSV
jgi:hypothetical protein